MGILARSSSYLSSMPVEWPRPEPQIITGFNE